MGDLSHSTDQELVGLSLENKRFFAEIVCRYEAKLRRYVYRLATLDPEDADDLLQDIFLKIYQNLNGFDQRLKFSSWVYRIAHNETMDYFRKRKVRPQGHMVGGSEDVLLTLASELDVIREVQSHEDREAMTRAIDALSPEYREIVLLKYFEYKSYDELSDILTLPPGTVATRLNRAKARLRTLLIDSGYTYG